MGVPVGTPQHFIPKLIDLYRKGLFPFDRLVAFYDFREINTAIDHFHRGAVIKPCCASAKSDARRVFLMRWVILAHSTGRTYHCRKDESRI
jgi:hypothetical protein